MHSTANGYVYADGQNAIAAGSTICSDGYPNHIPALKNYTHDYKICGPQSRMLHWLYIVVSNAEAFLLRTYHGLPKDTLQSYLDKFAFHFSRRSFGTQIIQQLIHAIACSQIAD